MMSHQLEREASMLNKITPMMRRKKQGNVYFDTPYRLRTIDMNNRKRFLALLTKYGKDEDKNILRSVVSVFARGSVVDFWTKYRAGYTIMAERFRGTRHACFPMLDAYVLPHIFEDSTPNSNNAHIVIFAVYPKQNPPKIVMYDSTYTGEYPVIVKRCDDIDLTTKYHSAFRQFEQHLSQNERVCRGSTVQSAKKALSVLFRSSNTNFAQRIAFHHIENFMHALQFVQDGLAMGRDTVRHCKASESEKRGSFSPPSYKFYIAGYGTCQRTLECGLFACYGMQDIAKNWRNPCVVHEMSSVRARSIDPNAFFLGPRMDTDMYTAVTTADFVRRYLFNWRVILDPNTKQRESYKLAMAVVAPASARRLYSLVKTCTQTAYKYVFDIMPENGMPPNLPWIDVSELNGKQNIDILIRIVDLDDPHAQESETYDAIARIFPYIRMLITVCSDMSIVMNYRHPTDHRLYQSNVDASYIYRLDRGVPRMARYSDSRTTQAVMWTTFIPQEQSRRDSFSTELPDRCDAVQWVTGGGWLPVTYK